MSTSEQILLPDIGDFDSVDVIEVLVEPGDVIEKETPLITLESDKATMDLPAPFSGTVTEMVVNVGDKIARGSLIAVIQTDISETAPGRSTTTETPEESAIDALPIQDNTEPANPPSHQPPSATRVAEHQPPPSLPPLPTGPTGAVLASPAVRRLARELGVNLDQVEGSGRKSRILKEDLSQFVKSALSVADAGTIKSDVGHPSESGIPTLPTVDFSRWGNIDRQPLSRIQKISSAHLHRAWLNVPHVTQHEEADVTELEKFRASLTKEADGADVRLTLLAFILKATAAALAHFPRFNASLDGDHLILKRYCHIGVAVDTHQGLLVPVIRDVDTKGVLQLAEALTDISQRARDEQLRPDDLQGGCFTISSLGGIGGTAFTPIVNAPEVAILGVARKRVVPLWDGEAFQPRSVLPLSLSYDHRAIDGAEGARFVVYLKSLLEDIGRVLL